MVGKNKLAQALIVTSVFAATPTGLSAQPLPVQPATALERSATNTSDKREGASVATASSPRAQLTSSELDSDGLRKDPRWPLFRHCIENTVTPKEFESCLQSALMTDDLGVGTALAPK